MKFVIRYMAESKLASTIKLILSAQYASLGYILISDLVVTNLFVHFTSRYDSILFGIRCFSMRFSIANYLVFGNIKICSLVLVTNNLSQYINLECWLQLCYTQINLKQCCLSNLTNPCKVGRCIVKRESRFEVLPPLSCRYTVTITLLASSDAFSFSA